VVSNQRGGILLRDLNVVIESRGKAAVLVPDWKGPSSVVAHRSCKLDSLVTGRENRWSTGEERCYSFGGLSEDEEGAGGR
jgi:hypothetical protein